jgi:hypothetical protein
MTRITRMVATTVITVGGTVAALAGLHLGQAPADAATARPAKAGAGWAVTLSAHDRARPAAKSNGRPAGVAVPAATRHSHVARHQTEASDRAPARTTGASGGSCTGGSGTAHHEAHGGTHSHHRRQQSGHHRTHHRTHHHTHSGTHESAHAGGCSDGGAGCE